MLCRYIHSTAMLISHIVDQELSAKIASELQMEQEIRDSENLPTAIADFLNASPFEVGFTLSPQPAHHSRFSSAT